jgi:hypothetical protein
VTALFFLLLAVAISVVGCTIVYLRQRTPTSVEWGIDTFKREMEALATRADIEPGAGVDVGGPSPRRPRRP